MFFKWSVINQISDCGREKFQRKFAVFVFSEKKFFGLTSFWYDFWYFWKQFSNVCLKNENEKIENFEKSNWKFKGKILFLFFFNVSKISDIYNF